MTHHSKTQGSIAEHIKTRRSMIDRSMIHRTTTD